ncbi:glucoamylase [Aspergillus lentulus]|uniref:Glucoamylase n=1 Tax=Aspergillus lentulus TaxID=293939 RepID=A0AAN4PK55_ASPLE|nr:glucoamylase [Aspergillus lentulus]
MKDETPRLTEMTRRQFLTIAIGVLTTVSALSDPAQIVIPTTITPQTTDLLELWLAQETSYALDGVFNNIGPNGAKATGAGSGIVVASPSQSNPDYYYTWTRDAALTIKYLVDSLAADNDPALQRIIEIYIDSQAHLQTVPNPSGNLSSGGLGEPKLRVDGSAFRGSWGRPQSDGPALRATTLISYANLMIDNGHFSTVESSVWPIIQNDLSYVTEFWNSSTFDLWEEVRGSSFFTTAVQHQALSQGAALAQRLGKTCSNCQSQAPQVLCFLQTYWTGSSILANLYSDRSGQDANSILGIIHTFDPNAGCDGETFQPCSDRALASHKEVVDSFRSLYPINAGIPGGQAVAVGRYPEDVYQGGHPWYLCTLAAAEQLYDVLYQWESLGSLTVTNISLAFFQDLYPSATVGTYVKDTSTFASITAAVRDYADGFLRVVQKYTPPNGALAEQFSRYDGSPVSAQDLTWSYTSFLSAVQARRRALNPSTSQIQLFLSNKTTATAVPQVCSPSSARGPYRPVKRIKWPRPECLSPARTVAVRFNILAITVIGEDIFLVGSIPALGEWDARYQALKLEANEYSSITPLWYGTVMLDAGEEFEYKFIRKRVGDGEAIWEEGQNRVFVVPKECGPPNATINAVWRW